jgi:hypothetical protein
MENIMEIVPLEATLNTQFHNHLIDHIGSYYFYRLVGDRLFGRSEWIKNIDYETFIKTFAEVEGLEQVYRCKETKVDGFDICMYNHEDYLLYTVFSRTKSIRISVLTQSQSLTDKIFEEITSKITKQEAGDGEVNFDFWMWTGRNGVLRSKSLAVPHLKDLKGNYKSNIFNAVKELAELEKPDENGKIVLWHGPPGNGKTYLIRALARAWAENLNANVEVITDPEQFFASPNYLRSVLSNCETKPDQLRLMVLEDCANLFSAKGRSSPGFNRLLNSTDGLMGQGQRVIYLLTANERIEDIDRAVIRAGRCLQRLEVAPLDSHEARRWLAAQDLDGNLWAKLPSNFCLADLYELKREYKTRRGGEKPKPFGF